MYLKIFRKDEYSSSRCINLYGTLHQQSVNCEHRGSQFTLYWCSWPYRFIHRESVSPPKRFLCLGQRSEKSCGRDQFSLHILKCQNWSKHTWSSPFWSKNVQRTRATDNDAYIWARVWDFGTYCIKRRLPNMTSNDVGNLQIFTSHGV